MNNGISDVSPLSGDPGCTETMDDWSADVVRRMERGSMLQKIRLWNELTDDELDMIEEYLIRVEGRQA